MSDRMTTLTVYTNTNEEGLAVYKVLSDIGGEMAMTYQSAWLSTHKMGDELDGDDNPNELYHDADTMRKVNEAIRKALSPYGHGSENCLVTEGIINELQNAGILFRERRR